MSPWQLDLLVASAGLALVVGLLQPLLRHWRSHPVSSYRIVCWVLAGTLLFPVGQVVLHGTGLSSEIPFAGRIASHFEVFQSSRAADAPEPGSDTEAPGSKPGVGSLRLASSSGFESGASRDLILVRFVLDGPVGAVSTGLEKAGSDEGDEPLEFTLDRSHAAGLGLVHFEGTSAAGGQGISKPAEFDHSDDADHAGGGNRASSRFSVPTALALLYLAGLVFALGRTLIRLRRTKQLLDHATPVTDAGVIATWSGVVQGSSLEGRVRLLTTPAIAAPMCFGLRRPVVLLPRAAGPELSSHVLSCVLLHELVHLERRDTWIMLGQEILRALFWFHPAASWLSKRIDHLRELSCDLTVVQRTGRLKRYASALVEYATWMGRAVPEVVPATSLVPWTTTNSQLARRIEMLVSQSVPRRTKRGTFFVAASVVGTLFGGQVALAASMAPAQGPLGKDVEQEAAPVVPVAEPATEPTPPSAREEEQEPQIVSSSFRSLDGHTVVVVVQGDDDASEVERNIVFETEDMDHGDADIHGRIEIRDGEGDPRVIEFDSQEELEELVESGQLPGMKLFMGGEDRGTAVFGGSPFFPGSEDSQDDGGPKIGITIGSFTPDATELEIQEVEDGSLADRAGLQGGDVIVEVDGDPATWENLMAAKERLRGDEVELEIERDGDEIEVVLRAGGDENGHASRRTWRMLGEDGEPHRIHRDDDEVFDLHPDLRGRRVIVEMEQDDDGPGRRHEAPHMHGDDDGHRARAERRIVIRMRGDEGEDFEFEPGRAWHGRVEGEHGGSMRRGGPDREELEAIIEGALRESGEDRDEVLDILRERLGDMEGRVEIRRGGPGSRFFFDENEEEMHPRERGRTRWQFPSGEGRSGNEFFFGPDGGEWHPDRGGERSQGERRIHEEHEGRADHGDHGDQRSRAGRRAGPNERFFGEHHEERDRGGRSFEWREREERGRSMDERSREIDELRRALDERRRELDQLERRLDSLMERAEREHGHRGHGGGSEDQAYLEEDVTLPQADTDVAQGAGYSLVMRPEIVAVPVEPELPELPAEPAEPVVR